MKLAYREFGSGQPLIILHGLFGQSDNWNTLSKNFAEKGFRVFALDQRNHGLSPHSQDWSYKLMADDLKEFIAEHQLEKPILLGHSMGGKTVMFFEMMYPGISSKLIIADIAPKASSRQHNDVLEALNAVDFSVIKTRKEAEVTLNNHINDFGTKQFLLKNIYWKENDVMDWRFNLKTITNHYNAIIAEVPKGLSNVKTIIIKGEKSNYITDADMSDFESRFPNSSLAIIKNAGHWVHAERPKDFFETVLLFIQSLD